MNGYRVGTPHPSADPFVEQIIAAAFGAMLTGDRAMLAALAAETVAADLERRGVACHDIATALLAAGLRRLARDPHPGLTAAWLFGLAQRVRDAERGAGGAPS